jgi:hypothetical protein
MWAVQGRRGIVAERGGRERGEFARSGVGGAGPSARSPRVFSWFTRICWVRRSAPDSPGARWHGGTERVGSDRARSENCSYSPGAPAHRGGEKARPSAHGALTQRAWSDRACPTHRAGRRKGIKRARSDGANKIECAGCDRAGAGLSRFLRGKHRGENILGWGCEREFLRGTGGWTIWPGQKRLGPTDRARSDPALPTERTCSPSAPAHRAGSVSHARCARGSSLHGESPSALGE